MACLYLWCYRAKLKQVTPASELMCKEDFPWFCWNSQDQARQAGRVAENDGTGNLSRVNGEKCNRKHRKW